MKNFELYLNSNPEIRDCIYYVDNQFPSWRLVDLLTNVRLDNLTITGSICEKNAKKILENLENAVYDPNRGWFHMPERIEYVPLEKILEKKEAAQALVFEHYGDASVICRLAELEPKYLAGEMPEQVVSSFTLWETFRKVTPHIHITTVREGKEPKVLQWDKREDTDIELSVVFPMYNVEKYLDQCISSVTAWKADYVEFLFVNDGSPDNSREVVLKWAEKDSRIKLLDKPNGGCASARQWGMDRARGRYIGFIDPDDFTEESMFRKLFRAAMEGSYEISYSSYREYYENTGKTHDVDDLTGSPYCDGVTDPNLIHALAAFCRVAIWRGIYSREMLDRANIHFYTEIRRFDDLPFKFETFANAKSVISVDEHLYYYRLARPGQDVSADDERLYVHFPIFQHLNESIAAKGNQKIKDYLQVCKIQTHRYALCKIKKEYLKEYARQAKNDLNSTGPFFRSARLIKREVGKKSFLFYLSIMTGNTMLLNRIRK